MSPSGAAAETRLELPDFLGIGALKAGTTYLDAMLRSHPQICMPVGLKEVDFFTRHYERGPQWYGKKFVACDGKVRGEVSPQYLFDSRVAARICDLIPKARLIVSVRDPVQRAYSQYKHWVQETGYRGSFDEFLDQHPGAVERGRYFALLRPYLEYFDRNQIHIVLFDDLVNQPIPTMQEVYAFVGVDPAHVPSAADEAVNVSGSPRFHRGYVAAKRVSRWLHNKGASNVVAATKRSGIVRMFRSRHAAPAVASSPELARRLADAYADDVAALSALVDRDLARLWAPN